MLQRSLFVVPLLVVLSSSILSAATGRLEILVRDVETHYAVAANLNLDGPESLSLESDATGRVQRAFSVGEYRIEVSAPGYKTTRTHTYVSPSKSANDVSGFTIMLTPTNAPEEEQPDVLNLKVRPGYTLVYGYAVDVDTGKPIRGVQVRLGTSGAETQTDGRGYYSLSVPTPPEAEPSVYGFGTISAKASGFNTIIERNIQVGGESVGLIFDMQRGGGIREHDRTPHLMRKGDNPEHQQSANPAPASMPITPALYSWFSTTG